MKSKILDNVDFEKANELLEGFSQSTGFVTAILNLDGKILSQSGWTQICTDFHRSNLETSSNCIVSDITLSNIARTDEKYHFYKCMNGLIDVVVPIVIRGEHIANLFSGQFFLEEPDISFFKKQANIYGFEETSYLEALGKVPVVSKKKVETTMNFLLTITQTIIEMTADKMEQIEINEVIRKSETALHNSQVQLKQNFKDLFESQRIAHLGTWHLDLATNQVVWSEELYKMYGFDPTMPVPPYPEHMKLFTPESWNRLSTSLAYTTTSGIPYELELETITKDGSNGWMWVRGEAEKDSEGNIISLWGVAQDITEKKKIEFEIKQSEEKFRLLFDKAPLGYQSLDFDGHFIDVNQQWLNTLGYSKEDVIGKWFGDFLCPNYVDGFRKRFPIFKSQGYIHSEFEMLSKDGQQLTISFEGKIGYDAHGDFKQTHCILQDITNQRKAEKALIESEERYRQLSEQSRTFVWEVDEQGMYTFVDHESETVLGYRSEELIQKKHFYDLCPEEEREGLKQTAFDVFQRKAMFRDMENKVLTKTGVMVVLSTNGFPILKNDGSLHGYRGSDTDITARKKIEEDLRKSEERFRIVQEISPDGFTILRPVRNETGEIIDFTFVYENQAIARLNQTDPQNVIDKSLLTLFPDHRGTSIFEAYIHVAKTGNPQILEEINVGEVISRPKWLRLVVISMGEEIAILAQDITESKLTEKEVQRFAEELELHRENLEKRLLQSVNAISKIGEIRDAYTAGHQKRVADLACAIGSAMGLVAEQIHNLSFGALIHDIGKLFIPSEILNKPGKISALEYQILQTHVDESYNVVKEIDFPEEIHTMIYQHHERLDGSGYPLGISGDEIILQSRIIAVADVVEAISSHRPYRAALGIDAALEEILLHRGTKYDVEVVDICVKLFKEDGYAL